MRRTGDLKLIQELNRYIILDTIRKHGPISRIEIAKMNGISPTTVTSAVSELIQEGLVCEDGTGVSNGGRKPILVRFAPDNQFLIGVSITHSSIVIAEMNLDAKVRRKQIYPIQGLTDQFVVAYILDSINQFLKNYSNLQACIGISIIVPGIVDAVNGVIRYNSKLRLKDVSMKQMIETSFSIKTWLDNDTNAIALAEKKFGEIDSSDNLLFITVDDGVGAGIIVNGSIFRGHHGGAGEFGHTSVDRGGIRCDCGNKGCLENYVSWPAVYFRVLSAITGGRETIMTQLAEGDITRISPIVLRSALEKGDPLAVDIMEKIAFYLAIGIANLVNLFNPHEIILGGEIVQDNQWLLTKVEELVHQQALDILVDGLKIRSTSFGEDFGVIGAAAVLLEDIFHFSIPS